MYTTKLTGGDVCCLGTLLNEKCSKTLSYYDDGHKTVV